MIDTSRISEPGYLESVAKQNLYIVEENSKQSLPGELLTEQFFEGSATSSGQQSKKVFISSEIEQIDLYRFMKHALPEVYAVFSHKSEPVEVKSKLTFMQRMLDKAKSKNKKGIMKRLGRFMGIFEDEQMIEVFDLQVESQTRLSIIDPDTNTDILESSDYV